MHKKYEKKIEKSKKISNSKFKFEIIEMRKKIEVQNQKPENQKNIKISRPERLCLEKS